MRLRRTVALFALVGLVSAPAIAVSSCFCRYTGEVMASCDRVTPSSTSIDSPDCCEVVTRAALDAVTLADRLPGGVLAAPQLFVPASAITLDAPAPTVARAERLDALADRHSPPPLERTGILLI